MQKEVFFAGELARDGISVVQKYFFGVMTLGAEKKMMVVFVLGVGTQYEFSMEIMHKFALGKSLQNSVHSGRVYFAGIIFESARNLAHCHGDSCFPKHTKDVPSGTGEAPAFCPERFLGSV
jgi:hypothetical protein